MVRHHSCRTPGPGTEQRHMSPACHTHRRQAHGHALHAAQEGHHGRVAVQAHHRHVLQMIGAGSRWVMRSRRVMRRQCLASSCTRRPASPPPNPHPPGKPCQPHLQHVEPASGQGVDGHLGIAFVRVELLHQLRWRGGCELHGHSEARHCKRVELLHSYGGGVAANARRFHSRSGWPAGMGCRCRCPAAAPSPWQAAAACVQA